VTLSNYKLFDLRFNKKKDERWEREEKLKKERKNRGDTSKFR
jgi:hypothetical protein